MGTSIASSEEDVAPSSEAGGRRDGGTVVMVESGDVDAEAETQREPVLSAR